MISLRGMAGDGSSRKVTLNNTDRSWVALRAAATRRGAAPGDRRQQGIGAVFADPPRRFPHTSVFAVFGSPSHFG
jgi:hypothetical protein